MGGKVSLEKVIYPEIYNSNYILSYPGLNEELESTIETSGFKIEFKRKYRKCLMFLDNLKRNCTKQKSFERLTNNTDDIYSMRILGEKNIRILFTYIIINKKEHVILLHVFQEKNGTNNGKDGYTNNIKTAKQRKQEIINDINSYS